MMRKTALRKPVTLALAAIALLLAAASCSSGQETPTHDMAAATPGPEQAKLDIVATAYPLHYFTGRIAGDLANVRLLVPPGAEPHNWEPTARTIQSFQDAGLIVFNGAGLEPWFDRLVESIGDSGATLVEAAQNVQLLAGEADEHDEDGVDPHVWIDPLRAQQMVATIQDALALAAPHNAEAFRRNASTLDGELAALHNEIVDGLESCAQDAFLANHAAFSYLADRYGIRQIAISGLSPEVEPSPARMAELISTARGYGIKYVLFESLVSPRVANAVARELGAQTMVLNPIEGLTSEQQEAGEDYFSVMRQNLSTLQTAMECNA